MDDPVFTVSRTFQAPRALVWKAHSEIEHLAKWWGPKGFTWLKGTLDFRPGGMFHYGMRAPNGSEMWGKFVYREIAAPERIVFVNSFSDPACGTTRAPFAADWPLEVLNELTLTEQDGRTTLTLRGSPLNATEVEKQRFEAMRSSMNQGFNGAFDRLEAYLATL
jgi:uncharacterized protein YndB with AHSA1/START domain